MPVYEPTVCHSPTYLSLKVYVWCAVLGAMVGFPLSFKANALVGLGFLALLVPLVVYGATSYIVTETRKRRYLRNRALTRDS